MTRNELATWMMKRIRAGRVGEGGEEDDTIAGATQCFSDPKKIVELEESFLPPTIDDERTRACCIVRWASLFITGTLCSHLT
jgi:hypothetical protein